MEFNEIFLSDLAYIQERKERAESGLLNCLELPFPTARKTFPGFERGSYIVVTANQKVGKSKFTDFVFCYDPICKAVEGSNLRAKILYFSLEERPKAKRLSFYQHLLYRLDGLLVDNKIMKSIDKDSPCPDWVKEKLSSERYQRYINAFLETVRFPINKKTRRVISNPDEIYDECIKFAEENGHYNTVKQKVYNEMYKTYIEEEVVDEDNPFTWNDDELMPIVIIDNFANLKKKGSSKYDTIDDMSKLCIDLKNLGFLVIGVQHQSQEKESLIRRQSNDVVPSAEGLDANKSTAKDLTLLIGLMSPFKYEMPTFLGYDIMKFKDNIRFMFIKEDRDNGAINLQCPLLFYGGCSYFEELPEANNIQGLKAVMEKTHRVHEQYERNFHSSKTIFSLANFGKHYNRARLHGHRKKHLNQRT